MKYCDKCRSSYPNEFNVCPIDNSALRVTSELIPGMTIRDKYLILGKVGEGGMGTVYRARHLAFNEIRALKVVHQSFAEDRTFIKRFKTEAIVARKLQHPNAVRIDDLDSTEDGRPFIVMELVEGGNLKALVAEAGILSVTRAINIAAQAADALAAAHNLGVVHRDIKPDNILVTHSALEGTDFVKVVDFGIAKVREGTLDVGSGYTNTRSGMIVGTPPYLSPEQAMGMHGDQIDGRADIYSLGIVLYMMLTGQLPFESDTPMGFLLHHVQTPPVPPHIVRPDLNISPALSAVLMKTLEKDRNKRFASADEMAYALRHLHLPSRTLAYAPRAPQASSPFDSSLQDFRDRSGLEAPAAAARPKPAPEVPRSHFAKQRGRPPLQVSLPASQKGSGSNFAMWLSATTVVLLVAIFAILYVSDVLSGSRSNPNSSIPNAKSGASPKPAPYTTSARTVPDNSSETQAPRSTIEVVPDSKLPPTARVPETASSSERPVKKQDPPARESAISSPKAVRKTAVSTVDSLISAGKEATENGEYDKAIASFQKAVQGDPNNAAAQAGLRRAQQAMQTEEQVLNQH